MNLAEELQRGPKLIANPELSKRDKARDMYRRGESRKMICHALGVDSQKLADWLRHMTRKPY